MQPIHEVLRHTNLGPLEAKRQNLRRALDQYLMEFNSCRCGPCFNNGEPVLKGTRCECQCPLGREGLACEQMEQKGKIQDWPSSEGPVRKGPLGFPAAPLCVLFPTTLGTSTLSFMVTPPSLFNASYAFYRLSRPSLRWELFLFFILFCFAKVYMDRAIHFRRDISVS